MYVCMYVCIIQDSVGTKSTALGDYQFLAYAIIKPSRWPLLTLC